MAELQRLDACRALDVLASELGNRAYFAASGTVFAATGTILGEETFTPLP